MPQALRKPWRCPHAPPARALPEQPRRGAVPQTEGWAGTFGRLGRASDGELIPHAHPALTHLRPFHQPETPQPFGWLSALQPGSALGSGGTSRAPGAAAVGTGRARGGITHLSRCEASLCAVGSVLCSCLRARSLANSPWQSCTPGREKQRVRPAHSPCADRFGGSASLPAASCARSGLAVPRSGVGLRSPCSVRTHAIALAAALLELPARSTLTLASPT